MLLLQSQRHLSPQLSHMLFLIFTGVSFLIRHSSDLEMSVSALYFSEILLPSTLSGSKVLLLMSSWVWTSSSSSLVQGKTVLSWLFSVLTSLWLPEFSLSLSQSVQVIWHILRTSLLELQTCFSSSWYTKPSHWASLVPWAHAVSAPSGYLSISEYCWDKWSQTYCYNHTSKSSHTDWKICCRSI